MWTISNVTAGTNMQIQNVIDSGLIPLVINALATVSQIIFLVTICENTAYKYRL